MAGGPVPGSGLGEAAGPAGGVGCGFGGARAAEEPVFPAAVRLGGASGLGWALGHHTHTLSVSLPPSLPPHLGGPLRALGLSAAEGRGLQG